ncbi:MAG: type II CRISPR-associated endonuclease Cas1 [Flavobacteriaceae bacterium]|nr:type II CRISPR-associated endonuclease Cas1 [Flavobacteriaceae bacterium]
MLKRTLFFSNPYHLSIEHKQLVIASKDSGEVKRAPVEDIGFVVFEHSQITFTQSVMQLLAENNTAVVFCDSKHHPSSMLLHLEANHVQAAIFRAQIQASEPLKKNLWMQTIKAKIRNQAAHLKWLNKNDEALSRLATQVKSGDPDNLEAIAARRYWPVLFGPDFTRARYGPVPNAALNYGYAILRAATARALAGSGLLPALGIHHRNKYNAFCLADDIMEPYRPFTDMMVTGMLEGGMDCGDLGKEEKAELLSVLSADVVIADKKRPLMIALSETTASLPRCFEGTEKKIRYPEL